LLLILQKLRMGFLHPGENFSPQLCSGLDCQFQFLIRDVSRCVVTRRISLLREQFHFLDQLRISLEGQFKRLDGLEVMSSLH